MPFGLDARLASFGLMLATGTFALALAPWRAGGRLRDDALVGLQAVELRVEEDGRTRMERALLPITIGRATSATLVIPDAQVSRLHARIDRMYGTLAIRDLDSRNGTLVNGRPIEGPVALRDGDEIDIGTARITFCGVSSWK